MKYLYSLLLWTCCLLLNAQHQDKLDFLNAKVDIAIDAHKKTIEGSVAYKFEVLQKVDTFFLDAQNLEFQAVLLNNIKVNYHNDGKHIIIHKSVRKNKKYILKIKYKAAPKQTVYFIGWDSSETYVGPNHTTIGEEHPNVNSQIWTQGQGKYTSHWLPSFDDMREKVEFDMDVTFNKAYEVIANGKLTGIKEMNGLKKWSFDMDKPMSSYLLAFAIGKYKEKRIKSDKGIPIGLYYYPGDSMLVEPTYRYTKEIFDFLEQEIGVPYPWQQYNQIPVRDFLYAGMENTGTTIFSDRYVIDSTAFKDRNYVMVNAHEMAHQWFGNLVTEVDGSSHWLHEGFATYYALLAQKEVFGKTYYYWRLYETALQLQKVSRENRGEALTNPKSSSLTFYEKGAWALHSLRELLGERNFRQGIQEYLNEYKYKNASIDDFLLVMERVSQLDLSDFKIQWLQSSDFPFAEAKRSLASACEDLNIFFRLQKELTTSSEDNQTIIKRYWNKDVSDQFKVQVITNYSKSLSEKFLGEELKNGNVMVRQAIAVSLKQLPSGLKPRLEPLLTDESYVTIEQMLYKLWVHYPSHRKQYLDTTKNIVGFPDKNIRLLWLTLSLLTKGYEPLNTNSYYQELSGYTSHKYPYEIRQTTFQFLEEVIGFSDTNLLDLINATQHHSWQFRKFSRALLEKLLLKQEFKDRIAGLKVKLNEPELRYISNKLNIE
ncbi:M1 family peptidase [Arenibacter aquaticus]|uniref:Aminopeptidase N n=1 Tax=Arenibacter aquaticus TaxID=2489054 RepID=A0A3S0ACA9_9FLAO|nr:M1 family metallopeptidase [Arenibacter aquaticus]RTE52206.1 M1 family peptidase [Arenibacter aquaticus]